MRRRSIIDFLASTAFVFGLSASRAHADPKEESSIFSVSVLDAESGWPVEGAKVSVREGDHELMSGTTGADGQVKVVLEHAQHASAEGDLKSRLHIEVLHFEYQFKRVDAWGVGKQFVAEIRLTPVEVLEVLDVTVYAPAEVLRPRTTLRGRELQESLQNSVPQTISKVPGVAVAYNGPGAARPTIRGLGGDRVLVLENGFASGDLYWSASDHGVMLEPLMARQVEVVRGPATLIYGGNALGGVVNVVRHDIPRRDASMSSTVRTQLESASQSTALGASAVAPVGPVAARLEASVRRSSDVQTPRGDIPNTSVMAFGGSAGVGFYPRWGELGASIRYFENEYGVPGEFDNELIPGGHPGGATIEARRVGGRLKAVYLPTSETFESIELGTSFTRYQHDEIEGLIDGQKALGAAFQLDSMRANLVAHHDLNSSGPYSVHGAAGITVSGQELLAGGNAPGVRSGTDWGVSGFVFEQLDREPFSLYVGLRYEHRRLSPKVTDSIHVKAAERMIEKTVTDRHFNLLSASLAAQWKLSKGWALGVTLARASRAPNLQELYADGPHLADFSFDIGTPSLPSEVGTGVDLFVLARRKRLTLEATGFVNLVDHYVQYTPTLETVRVFREGARPRATPVFEARAVDALFLGAEGKIDLRIGWGLSLEATLSYVWAERRGDPDPLPFIPPLHGEATLRYEHQGFFVSASLSGAMRQSRVPRPIGVGDTMERPQEPTAGYALGHLSAGWLGEGLGMGHGVTARAFNITNRVWRDHLSRIKEVAPQMGFNLALTYELEY